MLVDGLLLLLKLWRTAEVSTGSLGAVLDTADLVRFHSLCASFEPGPLLASDMVSL